MGLRPWSEFWTVREWRKKDGLLPMVGILWLDSAESQGMVGQRKMSCAPWFMRTMSWKYVQGQSWTMVVVFDHFSNFEYSHSWQHGGCGSEHKPRKPGFRSLGAPVIFSVVVAKLAFKSNRAGGS